MTRTGCCTPGKDFKLDFESEMPYGASRRGQGAVASGWHLKYTSGSGSLSSNLPKQPCPHSQPQPPLPDVLVWMFSGQRRVAYARVPAQDVLFSVVEEERGRDCGKIQSLLLTVSGDWDGGAGESGVRLTDRAGHQNWWPVVPNRKLPDCFQLSRKAEGSCDLCPGQPGSEDKNKLVCPGPTVVLTYIQAR